MLQGNQLNFYSLYLHYDQSETSETPGPSLGTLPASLAAPAGPEPESHMDAAAGKSNPSEKDMRYNERQKSKNYKSKGPMIITV